MTVGFPLSGGRQGCRGAGRAFLFIGAVSFVTVCTADWSRVVALANFMITAILCPVAGASWIICKGETNQICKCNRVTG